MRPSNLLPSPSRRWSSGLAAGLLLAVLALLATTPLPAYAQGDPVAYRWYDGETGRPVAFAHVVNRLAKAEAVFFGEQHGNTMAHWQQAELYAALNANQPRYALALEMIERDQQPLADAYLAGTITLDSLADTLRGWSRMAQDYAPMLLLADSLGLAVYGANVPRSLARMVAWHGPQALDTLSDSVQAYLPPLPLVVDTSLSQYQKVAAMAGGHGGHGGMHGLSANNFVAAQALKDATMAQVVGQALLQGQQVFHVNGAFHTDYDQGILWYLRRLRPQLNAAFTTTVAMPPPDRLPEDQRGVADFVLVTHPGIPGTHGR